MDVVQLRSFVVLAEHLHFGRAARALHLSQPALTKQIRRLEDELGGTLFERGSHGTKLSPTGCAFQAHAQALLRQFDEVEKIGRELTGGETGRLGIGFGMTTLRLVPRVVMQFRREHPRVAISLRDMSTAEQMAALHSGELDVGFVRHPAVVPADYTLARVARDRLALVQPAAARPVALSQCRDVPFVLVARARSPGFHDHVLALCARHELFPRVVQEVTEFSTALALVRAGMGLSFVPASLRLEPRSGLRVTPVAGAGACWAVSACWRTANEAPTLSQFRRLLARELGLAASSYGASL